MKYIYFGRTEEAPLYLPSGEIFLSPGDPVELVDEDLSWLRARGRDSEFRRVRLGPVDFGPRMSDDHAVVTPPEPERKRPKRRRKRSKVSDNAAYGGSNSPKVATYGSEKDD